MSLGPNLILGFLYGNPTVKTVMSTLGAESLHSDQNGKYLAVHVLLVAIYSLLFLHAYVALIIIAMYWDLTDRMLKFSCDALSGIQTQLIAESRTGNNIQKIRMLNSRLRHICQTFTHQRIMYAKMKQIIQAFVGIYITIVLPILILLIYVMLRLSPFLNWVIFICVLIVLILWTSMWANIYICSSSLYEHSNRFIKMGQTIGRLLKVGLPYWRAKFRSFRPIKIGTFGCHCSHANLLSTFSQFVHRTIKLLLL